MAHRVITDVLKGGSLCNTFARNWVLFMKHWAMKFATFIAINKNYLIY